MSTITHPDGSTDTTFDDGSTMTTRPSRRERDPQAWRSDYREALLDDAGNVEDTYAEIARLGKLAQAEIDMLHGLLVGEPDPMRCANKVVARVASLITTLSLVSSAGIRAASTIRTAEVEAD